MLNIRIYFVHIIIYNFQGLGLDIAYHFYIYFHFFLIPVYCVNFEDLLKFLNNYNYLDEKINFSLKQILVHFLLKVGIG